MNLKRKLLLFLTGVVCFILLFNHQDLGINTTFFTLVAWLLYSSHQNAFQRGDKKFWILSGAFLFSAGAFAFYGDGPSFIALFVSFYVVGIYLTDKRFNVLLYPILVIYSFGSFIIRIFFLNKWIPKWSYKSGYIGKWARTIMIPLIFAFIFLAVYTASSTMFMDVLYKLFPQIDLGPTILLGLLGFFFLFNFMYILPIPQLFQLNDYVADWEQDNINIDHRGSAENPRNIDNSKGGFFTLVLLNLLLVFFLFIYNYEQYRSFNGGPLSKSVHEQVNTVILSIVMAVGVIMYYFRPVMQTAGQSVRLNKAAYLWILLNSLWVLSAGIKNTEYISQFGLTFKRVGVYIFLILSFIGLLFTWMKLRGQRSNSYLITQMLKVFFFTIVLNCAINWSRIITRFNLDSMKEPDLSYLKTMDFNKDLLDRHFKNDPTWKNYLTEEKNNINGQQQKPFLSKILYYEWLGENW